MKPEQMDDDLVALVKAHTEGAEQRTAQWLYERAGHCTASAFKDATAKIGKGEAAARRNYRVKLAVERLINAPTGGFVNAAMQWGTEQEANARMEYEAQTGAIVEESPFIHHPKIEWCGGSPDGLIGRDGGVEFKCPFEPAVHVTTLMTHECEHLPQIQGLMWITGRKWWDFVSYDPRMPDGLKLYVKRIERDEKYIANLEAEITVFLQEVAAQHKTLMDMQAAALNGGTPKVAPQTKAPEAIPATDSPTESAGAALISAEQIREILSLCEMSGVAVGRVLLKVKAQSVEEIPVSMFERCIAFIGAASKK